MTTITAEQRSIDSFQTTLSYSKIVTIFQVILASWFMGICAQIKIPLSFTPVPLTVQTSGVMLVVVFLGSRKGMLAMICYLLQGSLGLPVLAGGAGGLVHFMGPTGGYLMAYIAQAYLIGSFLENRTSANLSKTAGVLAFSVCVQLGLGSLWLAQFVGLQKCFALGFYPFIASEMARALLIAFYIRKKEGKRACSR